MKNRLSQYILGAILVASAAPLTLAAHAHNAPTPSQAAKAATAAPTTTAPEAYETTKIRDLTAKLEVNDDETDFDELKKIGGAFATTYKVSHSFDLAYEYPNKARFDGHALGQTLSMVYNGNSKVFHTPIKSQKLDITNQPGQKQSLLDLGIFAKDYLTTDYKPTFQRREGALLVYDLTQRGTTNRSHEIVWVNPKTSIIEKRMSYNGDGKLMKELRYLKAQAIRPGIYVPTRVEIYNQFGKLGLVQDVTDIKVNLGVDEGLFDVS